MAKIDSVITLKGTFDGITFVKSAKYGDHIRRKRGSRKKAVLNDTCKKESKKLVRANGPAKVINDAIKPYQGEFYDWTMWSRLIATIQPTLIDRKPFDLRNLVPFEIHKIYPLGRLVTLDASTKPDKETSTLTVDIRYMMHPRFDDSLPIDAYQFEVSAIFPDLAKKTAKTSAVYSKMIEPTGKVEPIRVQIPLPPKAKAYLVCVRLDGFEKGERLDNLDSTGMRIVGGGTI